MPTDPWAATTVMAEPMLTDVLWWAILAVAAIVLIIAMTTRANRRSLGTTLIVLGLVFPLYCAIGFGYGLFSQWLLNQEAPQALLADQDDFTRSTGEFDWDSYDSEDLAYWNRLRDGGPFGRIIAPAMGLDAVVVKGASVSNLRRGPGWIATSALPGPTGNCAISGHRTTYQAPFYELDRLGVGDEIILISPFRRYRYVVSGREIVLPTDTSVIGPTDSPQLTLIACHPKYSASRRLVVTGELVEVVRLEQRSEVTP